MSSDDGSLPVARDRNLTRRSCTPPVRAPAGIVCDGVRRRRTADTRGLSLRPLTALLVLAAGTVLAYVGTANRRWEVLGAAVAGAGVVAWLLTNGPYEGAVLLDVFDGNGLTVADLLVVPALLLLAQLSWRSFRR